MAESLVVREVLDDKNYKRWSKCMKVYLLSQDLWDIIELDEDESKSWRIRNALALHAIHISCDANNLSEIDIFESAQGVWYFLERMYQPSCYDEQLDDSLSQEHCKPTPKDEDAILIDYGPFWRATTFEDWPDMESFLDSNPDADISTRGQDGRTALHRILDNGNIGIGKLIVEKTRGEDLAIKDCKQYTAFATLTGYNHPGVLDLLKIMVSKNKELPNIGTEDTVPIVMASRKGFKGMTRYLYSVTNKDILDINWETGAGKIGTEVLVNCIDLRLFDIASDMVRQTPLHIQQYNREKITPVHALAKYFCAVEDGRRHKKSSLIKWQPATWKYVKRLLGDEDTAEELVRLDDEKLVYDQARDFFRLVCAEVSTFDVEISALYVGEAMVEATKHGVAEFVGEMLFANPVLIKVKTNGNFFFEHAIENRQEKIFSLIYNFIGEKDYLLSSTNPENNNILHLAAKLPPSVVLDRSSGPALQMQRELQWFQEVWNLAQPLHREQINDKGLTPRALFTETHAKLMEDGEKAMKDTAQSSTVVGALIVTMMFAAAFAVPGGNNDTGLPIFLRKNLFRVFIVCDALSLYSSTTSVLVFLGILTTRYAEQDFSARLPRKLMLGLATLFFSITTMMISFCTALALMLDGPLRYILPMLACVPIVIFMSSIVPVMSEMFTSTFGSSIFDKSLELCQKIDAKKAEDKKIEEGEREEARNKEKNMSKRNEDKNVMYDQSSATQV